MFVFLYFDSSLMIELITLFSCGLTLRLLRTCRYMISEVAAYFLYTGDDVFRLGHLCIRSLARFFPRKPSAWMALKGADRALYMDVLSTSEPIELTARKIEDEGYWRRCCLFLVKFLAMQQVAHTLLAGKPKMLWITPGVPPSASMTFTVPDRLQRPVGRR